MDLDDRERRLLADIERGLARQDPGLDDVLRDGKRRRRLPAGWRHAITTVGLVLALALVWLAAVAHDAGIAMLAGALILICGRRAGWWTSLRAWQARQDPPWDLPKRKPTDPA
jgi:Protein of unknown function (DUF3040)